MGTQGLCCVVCRLRMLVSRFLKDHGGAAHREHCSTAVSLLAMVPVDATSHPFSHLCNSFEWQIIC